MPEDFLQSYKKGGGGTDIAPISKVIEIKESEFDGKVDEAAQRGRLLVVEFYGPKCPACRSLIEFYDMLSTNHPNQIFCKLNVRQNEQLSLLAKIEFLPTFIYYKDGAEVDREVGIDKKAIEEKVNKYKVLAKAAW